MNKMEICKEKGPFLQCVFFIIYFLNDTLNRYTVQLQRGAKRGVSFLFKNSAKITWYSIVNQSNVESQDGNELVIGISNLN